MNIHVNGKPHEHNGDGTLPSLLAEINADPQRVAVMINNEVVDRNCFDSVILNDGARIEVLMLAAGG